MASASVTVQPEPRRIPRALRSREFGTLFLLLIVVGVTTAIEPRYLSANSVRSILLWVPLLAIIGMGEMMVIIIRGIDVSVGSMVGLAGMIVGLVFRDAPWVPLYACVLLSILLGLAMGALNGALIAWVKVPAVIVTLGGLSFYRGLTFLLTQGSQIDGNFIPKSLVRWSQTGPFGIFLVPWVVIIVAVVAFATWLFMRHTRTGRHIYALGSNPDAARLRGLPVSRVTFLVYAITGALCGFAGLLYASRFGFLNPGQTGVGLEMTVIAAVVIGGVNVFGGSGSVVGVLLGCVLLGAINVALAVLGIAGTWQLAVYGIVILIAVVADSVLARRIQGGRTDEWA
jgi:rhamnose transport system permease protein